MKLEKSFFLEESVTQVARKLLGKTLCTYFDKRLTCGIIVETEAYSYREKACHAYNNRRTARTETLFHEGGTCYVYLCYGIHKLFNIVTNKEGTAEAVLIRAVEPLEGIDIMLERRGFAEKDQRLTSGPGKLSQALGIGLNHDKLNLFGNNIWVENGNGLNGKTVIEKSPRIGVAYAKKDALLPWRFSLRDNVWVSKGNNTYNF
ncbi:DNA-3-methyladenine glycosylase II [Fulvivirga imtechensis AK7]|uniref:Putative 3-methyladenine DNA glycosylase n=1 Tax=Fulvivirga imtechensis AK7 TaxID=1237149 RepID=L8JRK0_9BACT|nr:DNA-3-methyladenine glycosylase [Fulvivirga imtechensis]ELR70798.1 DNA-3-methyladenine glycosylase II [Fulvivirga imtechensis AK7]